MEEEEEEILFYRKEQTGDGLGNKLKRIVTSSALFVIAFILSNLLLQTLIAEISRGFKYTVKFSYNIVTVLPWDYHYWSRARILLIYLISPVLCLIIGLFIYNFLRVYSNWANVVRLFLFWFAVVLVNMVLAQILISPLGTPDNRNNGL